MKKTNKIIFIIIVLLIGLSIFFFCYYGIDLIKKVTNSNTIIVGDNAIFKEEGGKWSNISFDHIDKYNWKKYYTYVDNVYFGNYYLYNDDKTYLFEENNSPVNYNGNLLALKGDIKYKVVQFSTHDISNKDYVNKVLKDNDIKQDSILTSQSVIYVDIDNDQKKEEIYTISNKFALEDVGSTYFSFVFMIKNKKIIYLYKNIEKDAQDSYSGCKPYINSILDIDEDNQYEIILSCGYYSNNGIRHRMYKFKDGMFKLLVSN